MPKILLYVALIVLFVPLCDAQEVAQSAKKVRVLAVLATSGTGEIKHVAFSAVAFDILGQVVYLRRFQDDAPDKSFMRIGQQFVSYHQVKITNDPKGKIQFDIEKATVGCSVTVFGQDGTMKDYFSLPTGVFPDATGGNYFANIELESASLLPLKEGAIEKSWLDAGGLKAISLAQPPPSPK